MGLRNEHVVEVVHDVVLQVVAVVFYRVGVTKKSWSLGGSRITRDAYCLQVFIISVI